MTVKESPSPAACRLWEIISLGEVTSIPVAEVEKLTRNLIGAGETDAAIDGLRRLCAVADGVAKLWWLMGVALHDAQRHEEALSAMARAVELAPEGAASRVALAQLRYETGRPAAEAFAALHAELPDRDDVARNHAGALAAEGHSEAAEAVLVDQLAARPGWLEGHLRLATLRQTQGHTDFDRGYRSAALERPRDLALRMSWFQLLAKARRWDEARDVLAAADSDFGEHAAIAAARLFVVSEGQLGEDDPALFADMPVSSDPGLAICRVRHALRWRRPDEALRVASHFEGTPSEPFFWPYRSLAWRLTNDPRADWLDRPDRYVAAYSLGLGAGELAELAEVLRSLHTTSAPYLEQSVRGGTQTDRPLLFRHEPIIRRTRAAILEMVRAFVDGLPPRERGHPLLDPPRSQLRFSGSWSVRLRAQGHHVSHTHPVGWLSSALHVVLPDRPGPAPAGWLQFGTPPPELGLPLEAYRQIEPVAGTLVLFPGTMWHATAPFADGERLTVAFDVARPNH